MGRFRASDFTQPIFRGRTTSHHPSGRRDLNHVLSSSKKSPSSPRRPRSLVRHEHRWDYPPGPSPWDEAECQRFNAEAQKLLATLREQLGSVFEIEDESGTAKQT